MAKASVNPPIPVKPEITLVMSHDEAATLAAMLAQVSGSPDNGPRGHQEHIIRALRSAGYYWDNEGHGREEYLLIDQRSSNGIHFRDYQDGRKIAKPAGVVNWWDE